MPNIKLADRFPANTFVYLGTRTFRHKDEKAVTKAEADADKSGEKMKAWKLQNPHTFLDVSGMTGSDAVVSGGSDTVVTVQKLVRDKSTMNQVSLWRTKNGEVHVALLPADATDEVEVTDEAGNTSKVRVPKEGEYVVVINPRDEGLGIPLQPADKLDAVRTLAPMIYEAILAPITDEAERLTKAVELYDQLTAMKA